MDISVLGAIAEAFTIVLSLERMGFVVTGVLIGLLLGVIPGIGGLVGMALLLPFTYAMDPYNAFGLLLGMAAVTSTSDTIPAVLLGVPGTAGAQATVLDGNQMAKNGEAGRALSAAFTASAMGGLLGAALLMLTIPLLRPVVLLVGSPELLALSIFGISMVVSLSSGAPLKGLAAACLGIMISLIGSDPQTGTPRWTFDTFYLWDGMPLVPMVLGLFALPEIADLAIRRGSIAERARHRAGEGMLIGMRDAFRHWFLVMRCGLLGSAIGAIPGMGSSVVDWLAYGHAINTEKDARKTFGKGDVRGVIAPESANNSLTSGALVPTVAFGVPGSASMALLLGAFLVQGLVPGPAMLSTHLNLTYSMILSIALANLVGAGLCYAMSGALGKVALLRFSVIVPVVLVITFIGAFQTSRSWGDFHALLAFGVLGWIMKRLRWARPPMILGFVLGAIIERYMFISVERYGLDWLTRPIVAVLLGLSVLAIARPLFGQIRRLVRTRGGGTIRWPAPKATDLFHVVMLIGVVFLIQLAMEWPKSARTGPLTAGYAALAAVSLSLVAQFVIRAVPALAEEGAHHFDTSESAGLSLAITLRRAAGFLCWILGFLGLVYLIGILYAVPVFMCAYLGVEGRERLRLVLPYAILSGVFVWLVFDQLLSLPWPDPLLEPWLPEIPRLIDLGA